MTLAPYVHPSVRGVKGKPGLLDFHCAAPGCSLSAQQRHHLWPKSFLRGQPYEWVTCEDVLLQNSVGLCIPHHNAVTGERGHRAKIVWNSGLKMLEWWELDADGGWVCLGPLTGEEAPLVPISGSETEAAAARKAEGLCPTCGKPHRKKERDLSLPPRKTKTWTANVPADEEDGAAVLDEYVDDLSVALGFGDESKGVRRYHVLVNVLAWVTQVKPEFLRDWEEAKEA